MCEQFKTDFVEKIVQRLESDVINCVQRHYQIVIKPCIFKNAVKECYQFCLINNASHKCKECHGYVCGSCAMSKISEKQCVSCFMKDISFNELIPIACHRCKSKNLFCTDPEGMYGLYCKDCNSWI
jgi:hypothetical protein